MFRFIVFPLCFLDFEQHLERVVGVQFNEIADKTPFQDAMAPVYETYLFANPDLRPLVELIQATD